MARVPASGRSSAASRTAASGRVTPPNKDTAPYLGRWEQTPYTTELARFRAARANVASSPVDIFFWGNSLTMGRTAVDQGTPYGGYVTLLGDRLNARLGLRHGVGYYPCYTGNATYAKWTATANTGTLSQNERYGFGMFAAATTGDATVQITEEFDRCEIAYASSASFSNSFNVLIDDVVVDTVSTHDSSHAEGYTGNTWVSDPVTYGTHTVKIVNLNTSTGFGNLLIIAGIFFYKGNYNHGFRLWNGAHSGDNGGILQTYPGNYDLVHAKQPDLAVYAHFHNDRALSMTTFNNNMQNFINNIKTNCPDTDILLVSEYQTKTWLSSMNDYATMRAAMKQKAADNGVAYLDMGGFIGSVGLDGISTDPEGLVQSDGTHQSKAGFEKGANILHAFMEDRKPPSRIQSPVDPSPTPTFNPLSMCEPLHVGWANDPDWVIADGASVASWPNRGSVGGDPVQATGTAQPIYDIDGINTRASVNFDGDDVLHLDVADVADYSVIVVAQTSTIAAAQRAMGFGAATASGLGLQSGGGGLWAHYRGTIRAAGAANTNPHILMSASSTDLRVDNTTTIASSAGTNAYTYLSVGAGATGAGTFSSYWQGGIAFWAVYAGNVTTHPDYGGFILGLADYYGITIS